MTPVDSTQFEYRSNLYLRSHFNSEEVTNQFKDPDTKATQPINHNLDNELNGGILRFYIPSLRLFRWAGVSTLYVSEVDGTPIVKSHRKCSPSFIYVLTVALVQIFFATFMISNRIFQITRSIQM